MQQIIMKEEETVLDFFIPFYTNGCTLVVNNAMQCQTDTEGFISHRCALNPKYTGNLNAT